MQVISNLSSVSKDEILKDGVEFSLIRIRLNHFILEDNFAAIYFTHIHKKLHHALRHIYYFPVTLFPNTMKYSSLPTSYVVYQQA
jgi:hypothetical protein